MTDIKIDASDSEAVNLCLQVMTATQRRRWEMRLQGLTLGQIAIAEGVTRVSVWQSLRSGRKRSRKIIGVILNKR